MVVISIHFKNVSQDLRGKLVLSPEGLAAFRKECQENGITELVYLATCNRLEIYGEGTLEMLISLFAKYSGADASEIKEYARKFEGGKALRHLFHVTSGLDSMVIGEDEILSQVKKAYTEAKDAGLTGYTFNMVFQAAMRAAKRVKTETTLSKSSVSVATLAAAKCHKFYDGPKKVLLIGGSGDTGGKVMKNLISYGDCTIVATVRQTHIAGVNVKTIPYEERYDYINDADIIVSATNSPHYTVVRSLLEKAGIQPKRRLFVDLAVPSDIDCCVEEIEGTELIRIDAFQEIARQNNESKAGAAQSAEGILDEEMDELKKGLLFHEYKQSFEKLEKVKEMNFEKFFYKYKKLADAESFRTFLNVISQIEEAELAAEEGE